MTLHERLLAELDRREQIATAVPAGIWSVKVLHHRRDGTAQAEVRDSDGDTLAEVGLIEDAEHMVLHDPADALRRYAAARRVLERHHPVDHFWPEGNRELLSACAVCINYDGFDPPWPCADIRNLAASLGIEVSP